MRDTFLLVLIVALALAALRKPQVGILTWLWISIMNPHRLTYGFMYDFPLLDGVVAITMISCLIHWKTRCSASFHPILKILLAFYLWCTLTTIFSVDFLLSIEDWLNLTKTLLLVVCILLFMNKRHWIIAYCSVFVLSIGFTGFKGGVFTILTGGGHRVWGAPGTAWGDNNGVSVAMLIMVPIIIGMLKLFTNKWIRLVVIGFALSCTATIFGTQSRGGLVGMLGMMGAAIMRSNKKFMALLVIAITLVAGYFLMPQSWHDRMATIQNYEDDGSANTRLIQWQYAIDISLERPLFGNGFDAFFYQPYYLVHLYGKDSNRAVHSNYFQVLGEQGYIGIVLYLSLMITVVLRAKKTAARCNNRKDLVWASSILSAIQFSIFGYAFNGLTVNMAYLDLFYYIIALSVLMISYIDQEIGPENSQLASI